MEFNMRTKKTVSQTDSINRKRMSIAKKTRINGKAVNTSITGITIVFEKSSAKSAVRALRKMENVNLQKKYSQYLITK